MINHKKHSAFWLAMVFLCLQIAGTIHFLWVAHPAQSEGSGTDAVVKTTLATHQCAFFQHNHQKFLFFFDIVKSTCCFLEVNPSPKVTYLFQLNKPVLTGYFLRGPPELVVSPKHIQQQFFLNT